jgi:hypothetical protein
MSDFKVKSYPSSVPRVDLINLYYQLGSVQKKILECLGDSNKHQDQIICIHTMVYDLVASFTEVVNKEETNENSQ